MDSHKKEPVLPGTSSSPSLQLEVLLTNHHGRGFLVPSAALNGPSASGCRGARPFLRVQQQALPEIPDKQCILRNHRGCCVRPLAAAAQGGETFTLCIFPLWDTSAHAPIGTGGWPWAGCPPSSGCPVPSVAWGTCRKVIPRPGDAGATRAGFAPCQLTLEEQSSVTPRSLCSHSSSLPPFPLLHLFYFLFFPGPIFPPIEGKTLRLISKTRQRKMIDVPGRRLSRLCARVA